MPDPEKSPKNLEDATPSTAPSHIQPDGVEEPEPPKITTSEKEQDLSSHGQPADINIDGDVTGTIIVGANNRVINNFGPVTFTHLNPATNDNDKQNKSWRKNLWGFLAQNNRWVYLTLITVLGIGIIFLTEQNNSKSPSELPTIVITQPKVGVYPGLDPTEQPVTKAALHPLALKDNQFSVEKIKCMKPIAEIPIKGARNAAFMPDGQEVAIYFSDKIGIWNISENKWKTQVNVGVNSGMTQSPYGPIYFLYTTYPPDPNIKLVADNRILLVRTNDNDQNITAMAASRDGKWLALGYYNGTIELWDLANPSQPKFLGGANQILALTFSYDSHLLASFADAEPAQLWDVDKASLITPIDPTNTGYFLYPPHLAFSANDKFLFFSKTTNTGSEKIGVINQWDIESQTSTELIQPNTSGDMLVSTDQRILAIGGTFWDLNNHNALIRNLKEHSSPAFLVVGSFDGNALLSISENELIVWNLQCNTSFLDNKNKTNTAAISPITLNNIEKLQRAGTMAVRGLTFSPKDDWAAIRKIEDNALIVDLYSPLDFSENATPAVKLTDAKQYEYGLAFSPDSQYMAVVGGDNNLAIWDVANQHYVIDLPGCAGSPEFDATGQRLFAISAEQVCFWDNFSSASLQRKEKSALSDFLRLSSGLYLGEYEWDPKQGYSYIIYTFPEHKKTYSFHTNFNSGGGITLFSPDGKWLAITSEGGSQIFRVQTQSVAAKMNVETITGMAFSADSNMLAISSYEKISFYKVEDGSLIKSIDLPKDSGINYIAFSFTGRYLLLGNYMNNDMQFWVVQN